MSDATIRLWRQKANAGEEPYVSFMAKVEEAEQACLSQVAANATRLTGKDGRVAVDYLSRRDPEHWTRVDKQERTYELGPFLAELCRKVSSGELDNVDWRLLEAGEEGRSLET